MARPDGFSNIPDEKICPAHGYNFGVTAMQAGITLAFGKHKWRLIIPARVLEHKIRKRNLKEKFPDDRAAAKA